MDWPTYNRAQLFECRLGHRWYADEASACDQCHTREVYRIEDGLKDLVEKEQSDSSSDDTDC